MENYLEPYFYKLGNRIIDEQCSSDLINLFFEHKDQWIKFSGVFQQFNTSNNYWIGDSIRSHPFVRNLIDNCNLTCFPSIIFQQPNAVLEPHIDEEYNTLGKCRFRTTLLITPLIPLKDYAPLNFYSSGTPSEKNIYRYENCKFETTCFFDDRNSVLINAQTPHALTNTNSLRANFQLGFSEKFEKVVALLKNGKLFK